MNSIPKSQLSAGYPPHHPSWFDSLLASVLNYNYLCMTKGHETCLMTHLPQTRTNRGAATTATARELGRGDGKGDWRAEVVAQGQT